jgi:hypothetical protein
MPKPSHRQQGIHPPLEKHWAHQSIALAVLGVDAIARVVNVAAMRNSFSLLICMLLF